MWSYLRGFYAYRTSGIGYAVKERWERRGHMVHRMLHAMPRQTRAYGVAFPSTRAPLSFLKYPLQCTQFEHLV